jgi:peptidoglycan/LPS O-acetylase OafA/YrhL
LDDIARLQQLISDSVQHSSTSGNNTLGILDSLRAIAAMMVCLYHSSFLLSKFYPQATDILDFGQEGVYVFFVISGMVMPLSLDRVEYRISDFFVFMGKRILRLNPPMIVSACVVAFTSWSMIDNDLYNGWQLLLASATLTAPFFDFPWVNDIYWTLFVEMQYYIYIALAYPILTSKVVHLRRCAVIFLLATSFLSLGMEGNSAKSNLPFHLPVFLMGYYLYMRSVSRIKESEFWIGLITCAAVGAYLTGILHSLGFRIVLTALATSLTIRFAQDGFKTIGKIGTVSYSLYLMHWPVISTLCFFMGGLLQNEVGSLIVFAIIQLTSIAIAFLFFSTIERPALKWSKMLSYKR